jgi:hypothetical protein
MPNFRKKPVVIQAFVFLGDIMPDWFNSAVANGSVVLDAQNSRCEIKTLEGEMIGLRGDYIIKGVAGELYPCKPSIFSKTYNAE